MIGDINQHTAQWPAFAGRHSKEILGERGHGFILPMNNLTDQYLVLTTCLDRTGPQETMGQEILRSYEQGYMIPIQTAQNLGIPPFTHDTDGQSNPWPQILPPFSWN